MCTEHGELQDGVVPDVPHVPGFGGQTPYEGAPNVSLSPKSGDMRDKHNNVISNTPKLNANFRMAKKLVH